LYIADASVFSIRHVEVVQGAFAYVHVKIRSFLNVQSLAEKTIRLIN